MRREWQGGRHSKWEERRGWKWERKRWKGEGVDEERMAGRQTQQVGGEERLEGQVGSESDGERERVKLTGTSKHTPVLPRGM